MKMANLELQEVPLERIVVGDAQARKGKSITRNIEELMLSIEKHGLLQPVVLCPQQSGDKLEVLAGQRRVLAHEKLGRQTILGVVFDRPIDPVEAMVISLTENALREEMEDTDYIDACDELYNRYGTMTAVTQKTGIPTRLVSKYVRTARLPTEVYAAVKAKDISMDAALRATTAAEAEFGEGQAPTEDIMKWAKKMTTLSGVQQEAIKKTKIADPKKKFDEVVDTAADALEKQVIVGLSTNRYEALNRYASDKGSTVQESASELIATSLEDAGYLSS